jgi:arginyl-tRNA synthetase
LFDLQAKPKLWWYDLGNRGLSMKFRIEQSIFNQWPAVKVGILVISAAKQTEEVPRISKLLRQTEEAVGVDLGELEVADVPEVTAWQVVYRQFGANPKEFRSSVEALLRRAKRGQSLPLVSPLVDLGNYLSLKYRLPVGVEDLDKITGDLELAAATGSEKGMYLGGDHEESAAPGEVIYRDTVGFVCRRWNWREGVRTAVTAGTTNAVLIVEALPPVTEKILAKVLAESRRLTKNYLGATVQTAILSVKKPELLLVTSSENKRPKNKTALVYQAIAETEKKTPASLPTVEARPLPPPPTVKPGIPGLLHLLVRKAASAVIGAPVPDEAILIERPARKEYGDYATNVAMKFSQDLRKNPRELAVAIADALTTEKAYQTMFDHPTVAGGGFINVRLKTGYLLSQLSRVLALGDNFGMNDSGSGRKVALEHTNVNPNKALHIGHLRNACIGQAIERLWEANGYDVEVQYYVDDTGEQVAGTVVALQTLAIKPKEGEKFDHFSWEMYAKISELFETDPQVVEKKTEVLRAIEEGDNDLARFTRETATRILRDNLLTCHWFGFDYDVLIWEGDILRLGLWEAAFAILKKSPAFVREDTGANAGCWVIKDAATGGELGGDKVIVRSNGTVIYAGKDIAYHLWKFDKLGVDFSYRIFTDAPQKKILWTTTSEDGLANRAIGHAEIVLNVIDLRQAFTLGSVKVALKALGFSAQAENMHHIAYGVVYLSEGSMKRMGFKTEEGKKVYAMAGRKGIGIMADMLLEKVEEEVKHRYPESADVARPIAVAAIKYGMLSYNTFSDVVFDLDQALDLNGNSGPYLQYTYARTQSVLRRAKELAALKFEFTDEEVVRNYSQNNEELAIIRNICLFPEIVVEAAAGFSPNVLCTYLVDLASAYNLFYQKHRILSDKLDERTSNYRLSLNAAVGQVLKNGLYLLGIEALERM